MDTPVTPREHDGILTLLSKILMYPTPDIYEDVDQCAQYLEGYSTSLLKWFMPFRKFVRSDQLIEKIEEYYATTFDLNPAAFPYAGYQLYGEDYKRGLLMAGLKEAHQAHGIDIGNELADYIPLLVTLYTRIDDPEKRRSLCEDLLLPGCRKIHTQLENTANHYAHVIQVLIGILSEAPDHGADDHPKDGTI